MQNNYKRWLSVTVSVIIDGVQFIHVNYGSAFLIFNVTFFLRVLMLRFEAALTREIVCKKCFMLSTKWILI